MDDKTFDAFLAKTAKILDSIKEKQNPTDTDISKPRRRVEVKVRHIRTPEGAARFGGSIGDPITDDMAPSGRVSRSTVRRAVSVSKRSNKPRKVKPTYMEMDDAEREAAGLAVLERNERRFPDNPGLMDEGDYLAAAKKPADGGPGSHKVSRGASSEFSYMYETSSNNDKYDFDGTTVTWKDEEGRQAVMKDLDNWIDILDDHVQNETGAEKARQRRLKQAFQAFYDSLKLGGQKWDELAPEFKDMMGALVNAGTHEWVEDPEYDGVEALVEAGTMKALVVIYRDGSVDLDYEFKQRYVRNPKWWGVPYGTPIHPGMKPKGGTGPKG